MRVCVFGINMAKLKDNIEEPIQSKAQLNRDDKYEREAKSHGSHIENIQHT